MKHVWLVDIIALLIGMIVYANFSSYAVQSYNDVYQRQMDINVNYATDAAIDRMLAESGNIDVDYSNWNSMTLNPEIAFIVFEDVLLRGCGMTDSEDNTIALENEYIKSLIVCVQDGYYLFTNEKDTYTNPVTSNDTIYERLIMLPKLPYLYHYTNGGNDRYFAVSLGGNGYYELNVNTGNIISSTSYNYFSEDLVPQIVSNAVSDAMNAQLIKSGVIEETSIYIPSTYSEYLGANPVNSPTVLAFVVDPFNTNTQSFSIGGSTVTNESWVICYKRNGHKYYTYADRRDIAGNAEIIESFRTAKEAAQHGYSFDMALFD